MKNLYRYLSLVTLSALLTACSSNTEKHEKTKDTTSTASTEQATSTEQALVFADPANEKVFTAYIALKDKLVATDFAAAGKAAQSLAEVLKANNSFAKASLSAEKIANDKDIVAQRANFTTLSAELIPLFKSSKLKSGTIYVQHCPMANNSEGGDWLSREKKIQNPYYGDEMLECGAVIEKFASN